MNRGEILTLAELWLNANPTQANQDFTRTQLEAILNVVYRDEVNKAWLEGLSSWFRKYQDVTWPANEYLLTVPESMAKATIKRIVDITDNETNNTSILFSEEGWNAQMYWYTDTKLAWSTSSTGPDSERTLRFFYLANRAPNLVSDNDIPELLPAQHHDLLAVSVAVMARGMAEDAPPGYFAQKQMEMRMDMYKTLVRGRPLDSVPWQEPLEEDRAADDAWFFW